MSGSPPKKLDALTLNISDDKKPTVKTSPIKATLGSIPSSSRGVAAKDVALDISDSFDGHKPLPAITAPAGRDDPSAASNETSTSAEDTLENNLSKPKRQPPRLSSSRASRPIPPGKGASENSLKLDNGNASDSSKSNIGRSDEDFAAPHADPLDNSSVKPKRPPPRISGGEKLRPTQSAGKPAIEISENDGVKNAVSMQLLKPEGDQLSGKVKRDDAIDDDFEKLTQRHPKTSSAQGPLPLSDVMLPSAGSASDTSLSIKSDMEKTVSLQIPGLKLEASEPATDGEASAGNGAPLGPAKFSRIDVTIKHPPASPNKEKQKMGVSFSTPIEYVKTITDGPVSLDGPGDNVGDNGPEPQKSSVRPSVKEAATVTVGAFGRRIADASELADDLFLSDDPSLSKPLDELGENTRAVAHGDDDIIEPAKPTLENTQATFDRSGGVFTHMPILDGAALYERISFMRPHGLIENALKVAICKEDPISVDMLLVELGSLAPSELLLRDDLGRNCIHIAVMGQTATSDEILHTLMDCFSNHCTQLLKRDLIMLEAQYKASYNALLNKDDPNTFSSQNTRNNRSVDPGVLHKLSEYPLDSARLILYDWFIKECDRIKRRTEFSIEMWWLKAVTARDVDGRTPLHYAAIIGNTIKATCMLTARCRGRFTISEIQSLKRQHRFSSLTDRFGAPSVKQVLISNSTSGTEAKKHKFLKGYYTKQDEVETKRLMDKKISGKSLIPCSRTESRDLLQPKMYYNTLSGKEIGENSFENEVSRFSRSEGSKFLSATSNVRTPLHINRTTVEETGSDSKAAAVLGARQRQASTLRNKISVANIQNQLSAVMHIREDIESTEAFVDYEVIVPWLLRNMLRRAKDLSACRLSATTTVEQKHSDDLKSTGVTEGEHSGQAIQILKELFEDCAEAEKNYLHLSEDGSDPLYVSKEGLKAVLDRLGVRVTSDVLQEVIMRYQYFGRVENAISEFDFDDYVDEYDELSDELLKDNLPTVAEKKNSFRDISCRISTRSFNGTESSFEEIDLPNTRKLLSKSIDRNGLSRHGVQSGSRKSDDFNLQRHAPSTSAEKKFNKTWQQYSNPEGSFKFDDNNFKTSYRDDKDDAVEYNENFVQNRELRRNLGRSRRLRLSEKLRDLAKTVYLNVDLLLDDIESGMGLQSINLSASMPRTQSISGSAGESQIHRRKNLVRAMFQSCGSGSDAHGVLSVDSSEGYKYLYGDNVECDIADDDTRYSDFAIQQIETEISHDEQPALRPIISMNGVITSRRKAMNVTDRFGCTPLHLAAAAGHRNVVEMLVHEGADVTVSFQVIYSDPSLIKSGTEPATDDEDVLLIGDTIDHNMKRQLLKPSAITALALAKGPGVKSVLITALANRLEQKKGFCAQSGDSANASPIKQTTPIEMKSTADRVSSQDLSTNNAREFELLDNLSQLHGHKFNLSKPALSWAVSVLATDTVKQLIGSLHANPNAKDAVGRTPLHECCLLACTTGDNKTIYSRIRQNDVSGTAVMSKLRTIADILLEAGADPLATSVAGRAPLHELFGHPATVALRPQSKNMRTPAENQIDYFSQKERRAVLRSLIHWGADALQPDRNQGFTPMHYCAREDADECMMDFLSFLNVAGPSDAQGETQERGNHRNRKAVRDSRVERQKCGPYYRCYNGRTCLHTACVSSAFSVVNLLARWDADYAIIGSIRMCLQLARASKSFHLPEDEIQHDEYCLTTIRDCNGKTPAQLFGQRGRDESIITFWERCFSGDLARVEELIQSMHGQLRRISLKPQWQDVNESDTLFMTENSRITGREKLLKTNFSEDEKEDKMNGEDPEDRRCSKHLKAALSAHSDVWSLGGIDSKTRMLRWTPLHCCIVGWACASAIGFKGSGTNLCAKRALGTPPLNEAAILSKNLFKQSLQSEGSNGGGGTIPRFTNSGGFSGISHAREKQNRSHNKSRMDDTLVRNNIFCNTLKAGKHQMTSLTLLKNGAFVDSLDSKARTPLMLAAASNLLDAITLLLDAGADMGLRDNIGGNTALHYAYAAGSMAAASLLEERGADINVLNCAGKSPIDVTGVMSSIGGGITNVYAI